jgi:SAM-dependent methyltransferase
MDVPPPVPQSLDWAARWRALVAGSHRGPMFEAPAGGDRFTRLADRFAQRVPVDGDGEDPLLPVIAPLARGGSVIDVGAGVGRYALPLAALARTVVAVEPSPAMRQHLTARIAERGLTNVVVVGAPFETADLAPADFVLCAHVVHFVEDAPAFIRRADGLARRAVAFAIRHDPLQGPLLRLWAKYRSDPPPRQAAFSDLYNLLLAMGYAPNVTFYRRRHALRYRDPAEARAQASRFLEREIAEADAAALAAAGEQVLREACVWWVKD